MKNSSVIKIVLFGGIFMLILLLLIIVLSLINIFMPKQVKKIEKEIITNNYELTDVKNISFDFKKANSTFLSSDNEELMVVQNYKEEKFYLNYKIKDDQIYFEEDSYILNPQKKNYIIYIPKKYVDKITIINGFGNVNIDGISNDIDINNNSGGMEIKNIKNSNIKDVSGDLSFENVNGNLVLSSSTGDINIDNIEGSVDVESITGDITVKKFLVTSDSKFENVSGDITLKIDSKSNCKIIYKNETGKSVVSADLCKGDNNVIDIKNITGIININ